MDKTTYEPNPDGCKEKQNDMKKSCKTMKEKLEHANPYNIFFNQIPKATQTLDPSNSISFPDLLCPSLGKLTNSLQINFIVDFMWLYEQYQAHGLGKLPVTILYGICWQMEEFLELNLENITHHFVELKNGLNHTKLGIYTYEDGSLRVVISSANLYDQDWNHYNQGMWVSPACPRMDPSKRDYECTGPTNFKRVMLAYLNSYKLPMLDEWIHMVKRADFSAIKVFLITSTPGIHYPKSCGSHVHMVGDYLSKHCSLPEKTTHESEGPSSWSILAQSSSVGMYGKGIAMY